MTRLLPPVGLTAEEQRLAKTKAKLIARDERAREFDVLLREHTGECFPLADAPRGAELGHRAQELSERWRVFVYLSAATELMQAAARIKADLTRLALWGVVEMPMVWPLQTPFWLLQRVREKQPCSMLLGFTPHVVARPETDRGEVGSVGVSIDVSAYVHAADANRLKRDVAAIARDAAIKLPPGWRRFYAAVRAMAGLRQSELDQRLRWFDAHRGGRSLREVAREVGRPEATVRAAVNKLTELIDRRPTGRLASKPADRVGEAFSAHVAECKSCGAGVLCVTGEKFLPGSSEDTARRARKAGRLLGKYAESGEP